MVSSMGQKKEKFLGDKNKLENYLKMQKESIVNKEAFWKKQAELISWSKKFNKVFSGDFIEGETKWFEGGELNACYNCVDRHLKDKADSPAIVWEGDEESDFGSITFAQLHQKVCRLANFLKGVGVRRGDIVCIYLPMIPEAAFAMLACARIGATHNVVFSGFSPNALGDRLSDCKTKFLITAKDYQRGGRKFQLLENAKMAVVNSQRENNVQKILVFGESSKDNDTKKEIFKTVWIDDNTKKTSAECPVESMGSEDPLFVLYTSGSTGRPKGLVHSTGGYLVYAAYTHRTVFDIRKNDIFGCVADVGWITGHSYVIYGPLLNGVTTLMFQSTPLYPDEGRYWRLVERRRLTQIYLSPTAIRALQRYGDSAPKESDLTSLRVLGSVGEPINTSAWMWYFNVVGKGEKTVADTYWQTETGGIVMSALPGITPLKPGSAAFPLPGVEPVVLDPITREELEPGAKGVLCIKSPWPGMARTIFGDHEAFKKIYLRHPKGYYYTGDGAFRDAEGYFFITGRVDDVISIAGHRIGTAEVESAICSHKEVAECAVIGVSDVVKGQKWLSFVVKKDPLKDLSEKEVCGMVRSEVGPFAAQGDVVFVRELPKTRSGKIVRRVLRKIAEGTSESIGDVSTMVNPESVAAISAVMENNFRKMRKRIKLERNVSK